MNAFVIVYSGPEMDLIYGVRKGYLALPLSMTVLFQRRTASSGLRAVIKREKVIRSGD